MWPWIVLALVTLRDGIGADDLIWLAGLVAAVTTILAFLQLWVVRPLKWLADAADDWRGTPARPGHKAVPGIAERIQLIEAEMGRNGGESLKDRVCEIDRKLDALTEAKRVEHAAIRSELADVRRTIETKEC